MVDLGRVYKSTITKMSEMQWLRFKEGVATTPLPLLASMSAGMA